jgi:stage II sporulation protein D (peptidoglycan lytic transglycosylase)
VRSRRLALLPLVLALASGCTGGGSASTASSSGEPVSASTPSPAAGATVPTVSSTRISVELSGNGSFLVHAVYPKTQSNCKRAHTARFRARYPGALSVKSADDGTLSVVVTLPFEKYLEGIAEMPPSWPPAALQAQAIAARSYALAHIDWSGQQGAAVQQAICATTECQVYGGIPVPPSKDIGRWDAAVRQTEGQVLLYSGSPADTVYFSTSNGHTYGNDQVFGSAPLPYLRPVAEHDDGASPTSHWRVPIPFRDLATFLTAGGLWPSGKRISSVHSAGSNVVVTGAGTSKPIDAGTFRDTVNTWAPCLEPGRYPTGALPATIPSDWYGVASGHSAAVATGRGWGHGVGMVQWGAYGKAKRGWSADRILAYYYGGLVPQRYPEPGLIHVIVATGLASLGVEAPPGGATINGQPFTGGTVTLTGNAGTVTAGP